MIGIRIPPLDLNIMSIQGLGQNLLMIIQCTLIVTIRDTTMLSLLRFDPIESIMNRQLACNSVATFDRCRKVGYTRSLSSWHLVQKENKC